MNNRPIMTHFSRLSCITPILYYQIFLNNFISNFISKKINRDSSCPLFLHHQQFSYTHPHISVQKILLNCIPVTSVIPKITEITHISTKHINTHGCLLEILNISLVANIIFVCSQISFDYRTNKSFKKKYNNIYCE